MGGYVREDDGWIFCFVMHVERICYKIMILM